jgi:hypothetical protein
LHFLAWFLLMTLPSRLVLGESVPQTH